MRFLALAVAFFALSYATVFASAPEFPALTGRIVDTAHLLDAQTMQRLSEKLARLEQATGEQVVIVTLPTLNGFPIEEYGYRLGRAWGIGQKDKNNGALLIVSMADRTVRIEVGYGLEDRLTDAASSLIITRLILPEFRTGDYSKGIEQGADAMLSLLGGKETPQTLAAKTTARSVPAERSSSPWKIVLIVIFVFWLLRRSGGRSLAGPMILGSLLGRSGGGGFGGFSGGGGGFGGGGASGRW